MVNITKLQSISFKYWVSKRSGNVGFNKNNYLEGNHTLKILDKEYYISIINFFVN